MSWLLPFIAAVGSQGQPGVQYCWLAWKPIPAYVNSCSLVIGTREMENRWEDTMSYIRFCPTGSRVLFGNGNSLVVMNLDSGRKFVKAGRSAAWFDKAGDVLSVWSDGSSTTLFRNGNVAKRWRTEWIVPATTENGVYWLCYAPGSRPLSRLLRICKFDGRALRETSFRFPHDPGDHNFGSFIEDCGEYLLLGVNVHPIELERYLVIFPKRLRVGRNITTPLGLPLCATSLVLKQSDSLWTVILIDLGSGEKWALRGNEQKEPTLGAIRSLD